MEVTIDVQHLVNLIRAAKVQNVFKVQEVVEDQILPGLRSGGDPAAARAVAETLTNEKRKLGLWGIDLSRIEHAWARSSTGRATAETGNGDKSFYVVSRHDWSVSWGGGMNVTYLEALPQHALMRMARLDWKPEPPLLSDLDVLVNEVNRD